MNATVENIVTHNGLYRSDPRNISPWGRMSPTFSFYRRFVAIVIGSASKAKRNRYQTREWYLSSLEVLMALERVGVRVEISGLGHSMNLASPCVLIANHMSVMETVILPRMLLPHREVTFVVKESLLHYPIFKHVMRSRDPIAVSRKNPRGDLKAILTGGVERLQRGVSVIVFPQTTRTPHFDPEQFNSIGVKLAQKAKVPVVPLALMTDAWRQGRLVKDFGRIDPSRTAHFAFGEPIEIEGRGTHEHERIVQFITSHLRKWQGNHRVEHSTNET